MARHRKTGRHTLLLYAILASAGVTLLAVVVAGGYGFGLLLRLVFRLA